MANILYLLGFLVIMGCLFIPWSHRETLILVLSAVHLGIGVCFMIEPRAFAFQGDCFKLLFAGAIEPELVGVSFLVFMFLNFYVWWEIG